ncbi:bifunctional adenosylcobinamide kinase/adenosylcobinamide-phosphate guanylyltransferase [Levilactobacillus yiduensis]|uniref:bifunctional adenosylcobinamide kinase/adenosylcobinamide-phosphate guanylyltransferase n=1 Tax=Levilactobacillus yiduensis TaxID=2953880 RepID=UPI000EF30DA9|nr:bifunctional adenosylcobinamide kinase/adenosylcobinamide-phosphate guanylyltransferase [Levilactobacillus yiduensis]AYM02475.1 bifunctional adenosylcobinamide kinase/adenosylcobinamide-phosphate guanylyltransferase [Levilactobacillus brevis]
MSKLVLVTGGAKSGKSAFAEAQSPSDQIVCYLATGVMQQPDAEMTLRIQHHQQRRPHIWVTEERFQQVPEFIKQNNYDHYLLDDVTMLTTNKFYAILGEQLTADGDFDRLLEQMSKEELDNIRQTILTEWHQIVTAVRQKQTTMVMVTNEVGLGLVPATKQARILRDIYGEVNQFLAHVADEVYFVISGLPQRFK